MNDPCTQLPNYLIKFINAWIEALNLARDDLERRSSVIKHEPHTRVATDAIRQPNSCRYTPTHTRPSQTDRQADRPTETVTETEADRDRQTHAHAHTYTVRPRGLEADYLCQSRRAT